MLIESSQIASVRSTVKIKTWHWSVPQLLEQWVQSTASTQHIKYNQVN